MTDSLELVAELARRLERLRAIEKAALRVHLTIPPSGYRVCCGTYFRGGHELTCWLAALDVALCGEKGR